MIKAYNLKKIIKNTDILIFNKEEAQLLVGKNSLNGLFKKIYRLGPSVVVITDGKKAVHAYDGKIKYTIKPHNIKIKETTGAGDAFASAFLAGMIKKKNIEFALKLGLANAESIITHIGTKNKLLRYNEALKVLKKPTKIIKTALK